MMPKRGFTLVELLIVVAIIVVLVGILVPSLSHSYGVALDARCRNHMRELSNYQRKYALDHKTYTKVWTEEDKVSWRTKLLRYAVGGGGPSSFVELLKCTAVDEEELASQPADPGNDTLPSSYGLNGCMQFAEWRFRPSVAPSGIIVMGEQAVSVLECALTSDSYGVWSSGNYSSWFQSPEHSLEREYRHGGAGANYAMVDLSVERLNQGQLKRASGRWYWWDALAYDTTQPPPPDSGSDGYTMPQDPTPNPEPQPKTGTDPNGPPQGPYTHPCGCPR